MIYSAEKIAEYILWRLQKGDLGYTTVSNLKLQKILYFLQADCLVQTNAPLFKDEIVAWNFGPVVIDVYMKYRVFGGAFIPNAFIKKSPLIAKDDAERIDNMLVELNKYSSVDLTKITLNQRPWKQNYIRNANMKIPNSDIQAYFAED